MASKCNNNDTQHHRAKTRQKPLPPTQHIQPCFMPWSHWGKLLQNEAPTVQLPNLLRNGSEMNICLSEWISAAIHIRKWQFALQLETRSWIRSQCEQSIKRKKWIAYLESFVWVDAQSQHQTQNLLVELPSLLVVTQLQCNYNSNDNSSEKQKGKQISFQDNIRQDIWVTRGTEVKSLSRGYLKLVSKWAWQFMFIELY